MLSASNIRRIGSLQRETSVATSSALPAAVPGLHRNSNRRAGPLAYYSAGVGRPLLLVHSINAAPSAFEMRPLFERMRSSRRVYAVDLPGFGRSDRSARDYSVPLFVDAIHDMLDEIAVETPGEAVDIVALSLSAEFAARAAVQQPQRIRSLTLITPTGFNRGSKKLRGPAGATRELPGLLRFYRFPLWSQRLYNLLVSRPSIRYFWRRTYGSRQIDQHLADYAFLSSHQPGARYAPLAFLSLRLFSKDIRDIFERLTMPVWMPHGTRGDFRDFSEADWTRSRHNWRVDAFDTGAMVHYEQPDDFAMRLRAFLGEPVAQKLCQ